MNTNEMNVLASNLQHQIYQLVKNHEKCEEKCLSQHGVTVSQGYTLLSLPQDGSFSMNELSELMGITGSTMTRIVDPLVNKKLVRRKPDDQDRRIVRVSLTGKGQTLKLILERELQEFFQYVLGEIQDEEFKSIISSINRINEAFLGAFRNVGDLD